MQVRANVSLSKILFVGLDYVIMAHTLQKQNQTNNKHTRKTVCAFTHVTVMRQ